MELNSQIQNLKSSSVSQKQGQAIQNIYEQILTRNIQLRFSTLIEPPPDQSEVLQKDLMILKNRIQQSWPFTDMQFPPNESSLMKSQNLPNKFKEVIWKRISNIMGPLYQQIGLFTQQGPFTIIPKPLIDDRYFISALNILQSKPEMFLRNFEIIEPNQSGLFSIWLNEGGVWKLMIIDDQFPCIDENYALSQSVSSIWIFIVEKCMAKLYGGYSVIDRGLTHHCLTDITGCPTEVIDQDSLDQWWDILMDWQRKEFLLFANKEGNPQFAIEQLQNLQQQDHFQQCRLSYSILDLQEIDLKDGQKERLILLKSPIKQIIFNGNWMYSSSNWVADLRKRLNVTQMKSEDGTFWMSLNEFNSEFQQIGCCKIQTDYKFKWFHIDQSISDSQLIRFNLKEETHIYITIHQPDERKASLINQNYQYVFTRLLLAKIEPQYNNALEFIQGVYECNREITIEEFLLPGDYLITLEVSWPKLQQQKNNLQQQFEQTNNDSIRYCNISFCSRVTPNNIQIIQENFLDTQKKIIKNMSLKNHFVTQKVRDYSKNQEPNIKVYSDIQFGFIYFLYQNRGQKKLREQVNMNKLENLQICQPYTDSKEFTVTVTPGNDILVLYKYDPLGDKFSFSSSIKAALDNVTEIEMQQNQERPSFNIKRASFKPNTLGKSLSKQESDQINNNYNSNTANFNSANININNSSNYLPQKQQNSFSQADLIRIMGEQAKQVKRVWNDQEINVFVYHFQHIEGAVIMFLNYSETTYEEYMDFQLQNLKIKAQNQNGQEENIVRFILNPYEKTFIFLEIINRSDPFAFKYRSYYKYYVD